MKLPSPSALLACIALAAPLGAQAAMDNTTRSTFINECVSAAKAQNLDEKSAKAHCDCGAKQVDGHFSQAEITKLNNSGETPDPQLTQKLRTLVAENCVAKKN
ncbi:hypothetical protein NJC40_09670 [Pseudomonas sp. 21LCFQ02]|uniref:hypothetical protein n=1 Tax=unclassified Pseudomonas TaxID=196821 RepID=UPI0004F72D17|nr:MULTISPECIES: hypothetical protein [unclassified Pseudomonas]MCO8160884.1 hypothetical protein [Pseudomonas sp. 21LCFQ010]MCO8168043.1 hypothetical protein [Pseudomonas sp. 21LCFQ02]MCQ9423289.1 hypothetical protein [Pseudomonas sp. LJDD11]BAP44646.1 putative uncharacterized protein [Pseudomonas sp. StFLB209]